MIYKDYPNIKTSLLVRLWKYKNRHKTKEPYLIIKEDGVQTIAYHTPYGILSLIDDTLQERIIWRK